MSRSDHVRRLATLVRKETYQIARDPSSVLIALVLPVILLFLFGYAVSLDTGRTRIGLVVEEATPLIPIAEKVDSFGVLKPARV